MTIWIYRQTFFSIAIVIVQFYGLTKLPELLKITVELTFKWFPCCQCSQANLPCKRAHSVWKWPAGCGLNVLLQEMKNEKHNKCVFELQKYELGAFCRNIL